VGEEVGSPCFDMSKTHLGWQVRYPGAGFMTQLRSPQFLLISYNGITPVLYSGDVGSIPTLSTIFPRR